MIAKAHRTALAALAVTLIAVGIEAGPQADPSPARSSGPSAIATFGSGCYWCTESDFDKLPGVIETVSGFMGGATPNPTYEEVSDGGTGHVEVVQVTYDPTRVSYAALVDHYWRHTDVLDGRGQFCDRGETYRPVIFAHDQSQEETARTAKAALDASKRFSKPVAVAIEPAARFWPGPREHQDYYRTHALRYKFYRAGCDRDARLKKLWGSEAGS